MTGEETPNPPSLDWQISTAVVTFTLPDALVSVLGVNCYSGSRTR
jgi:hypothetical protein